MDHRKNNKQNSFKNSKIFKERESYGFVSTGNKNLCIYSKLIKTRLVWKRPHENRGYKYKGIN